MTRENRKKYCDNWEYISLDIRLNRAKNRCERCGVINDSLIHRHHDKTFSYATKSELELVQIERDKKKFGYWQIIKSMNLTRVVLSVAHLDQNRENNDYKNLRALCSHCHLRHDKYFNWISRKTTTSANQLKIEL